MTTLDAEQIEYQRTITEFAKAELNTDLEANDHRGLFPHDAWMKCAAMGIQGLPVDQDFGGSGADAITVVAAMEALGRGCWDNGLLFSLNAQMWACEVPLLKFGTQEQKERYLPGLCDGSLIAAHAMSEPEAGSDPFSLRTKAKSEAGWFTLNGSKVFVSNGPVAGLFIVFARTSDSGGIGDLTAFLIDRETPGLTVGPPLSKMGLRTSPMSEVFLDDCRVPASQILGKVGSGAFVFNHSMEWERSCILASTVGTMEALLQRCIAHAQERRQFGRAIGTNQAIANRIVSMKLRLETSRLLVYDLAQKLSEGKRTTMESALTKLHLSESFLESALDAVQIFGGYGYMTEYGLERIVRDAVGSRLYSGTSEMQMNVVSRLMGMP